LIGARQACEHPPQFNELLDVEMHELPHWVRPLLHAKPQTPLVHVAVEFAGAEQALPQPPQFIGSVEVFVQPDGQAVLTGEGQIVAVADCVNDFEKDWLADCENDSVTDLVWEDENDRAADIVRDVEGE